MRLSLLLLAATVGLARGNAHEASVGTAPAPILCPPNYCLHRVAMGNTAASFTCEWFPDEGHYCAPENVECTCDGHVKYGDFESGPGGAGNWSEPKDVMGKIMCNTDNFGSPKTGAKSCWCTPRYLLTEWSTQPSRNSTKACGSPSPGYDVPECLANEVRLNVGLPPASLWGMGYNRAAASAISNNAWDWTLSSLGSRTAAFDKDTLGTTIVTPCRGGWEECWKFEQKALALRTNVVPMNDNGKLYIDYYPELGDSFQTMRDLVNFEFITPIAEMGTGNASCPAPAPAMEPASGAVQGGVAVSMLALVLLH